MTAEQQAALRLMVLRTVARQVKEAERATEAEIRDGWEVDTRIPAHLPDGTKLGRVELRDGRVTVRVVDEDKLAAYVGQHWPTEVETVTRVRPAFLAQLKDKVTSEGEVIPGLEVSIGDPTPYVTGAKEAAEPVVAAFRAGALTWGAVLPELEPPPEQ